MLLRIDTHTAQINTKGDRRNLKIVQEALNTECRMKAKQSSTQPKRDEKNSFEANYLFSVNSLAERKREKKKQPTTISEKKKMILLNDSHIELS